MKTKNPIFWTLVLIFLIACNTTKPVSSNSTSVNSSHSDKEMNQVQAVDLAEYLSRISGISVTGTGNNARVSIRGMSALNTDVEPLFVINGVPVNGGLSAASANMRISDIKSVRVLKSASETAFYGDRGSSGVILISMKY